MVRALGAPLRKTTPLAGQPWPDHFVPTTRPPRADPNKSQTYPEGAIRHEEAVAATGARPTGQAPAEALVLPPRVAHAVRLLKVQEVVPHVRLGCVLTATWGPCEVDDRDQKTRARGRSLGGERIWSQGLDAIDHRCHPCRFLSRSRSLPLRAARPDPSGIRPARETRRKRHRCSFCFLFFTRTEKTNTRTEKTNTRRFEGNAPTQEQNKAGKRHRCSFSCRHPWKRGRGQCAFNAGLLVTPALWRNRSPAVAPMSASRRGYAAGLMLGSSSAHASACAFAHARTQILATAVLQWHRCSVVQGQALRGGTKPIFGRPPPQFGRADSLARFSLLRRHDPPHRRGRPATKTGFIVHKRTTTDGPTGRRLPEHATPDQRRAIRRITEAN